jgi:hypothetical protein
MNGETMKIKIKNWGFSGVKRLQRGDSPEKEDYENARFSHTDSSIFLYRQFYVMNKEIEVRNTSYFSGLMSFIYKDYRCVLDVKNFEKLE